VLYQVGVLIFRLEVLAPELGTPYLEAAVASWKWALKRCAVGVIVLHFGHHSFMAGSSKSRWLLVRKSCCPVLLPCSLHELAFAGVV
jgi:hypothetical protein